MITYASSTKSTVNDWRDRKKEVSPTCNNKEQCKFIDIIANRVIQEVDDVMNNEVGKSDPLLLLVAGSPGVGKSFAIKSMKSLFDALGWLEAQHYQFAAFQAVVASQIGGDTLHHTCGISFGSTTRSVQQRMQQARNLSMMRWLVIDEISQVGAELLAQCERNMSAAMQGAGTYKLNPVTQEERPWGGMNVIYVGNIPSHCLN